MKQTEYSSLGLDVKFNVPSSVEEFDSLAKRPGACLDEATNNCVYRGSLAEFRDVFLHGRSANPDKGITAIKGVEAVSGIDRKSEPVLDKENKQVVRNGENVEKYTETEGDYFKRVCAEKGVEPSHFATLAQDVANSIIFDPSATERKPAGPKKLPAEVLAIATAKYDAGKGEAMLHFIEKDTKGEVKASGPLTGTKDTDIQIVGWAIKNHITWKSKQTMNTGYNKV